MSQEQQKNEPNSTPAFTEDVYSTSPLARSISHKDEVFSDQPLPELPPQSFTPPTPKTPKKAINGISWNKQRRIARRDMVTLNNGEPLSFAMRKIIVELLVVILFIALVVGCFFARQFVLSTLTQDTFGSLSNSTRYGTPQAVNLTVVPADSAGYSCMQAIGSWAGVAVDSSTMQKNNGGKDITGLADGMEKALTRAITNKTVTRKENSSNYTLLTQIYDSLKAGAPVLVSCTTANGAALTWALVTAMDNKADQITLLYSDSTTATLTAQDFIASTRHQTLSKKDLGLQLAILFGFYNKNTAFFFTAVEE